MSDTEPGDRLDAPRKKRRVALTLLRLAIGVGLLVYLAKSHVIDLEGLRKLVEFWPISLAAMAIFLLDLALMALRLCLLLRPHGMRLPYRASLELTLVSSFFALFLPGRAGGDIARIFYASKATAERHTEVVSVLLFDRALGLFSLLVLPLLFAPMFHGLFHEPVLRILLGTSAVLAGGMLAAFVVCRFAPSLLGRLMVGRLKTSKLRGILERALNTVAVYAHNPGTLAAALAIALADNLLVIAVTALALVVVNPASLTAELCVVVPMGEIVNSLPLTPGGLGVGEAAFDALFKLVGLHGGAEALLCWRIWNLLVSLLGLPFYLHGFRGRVQHEERPASV